MCTVDLPREFLDIAEQRLLALMGEDPARTASYHDGGSRQLFRSSTNPFVGGRWSTMIKDVAAAV